MIKKLTFILRQGSFRIPIRGRQKLPLYLSIQKDGYKDNNLKDNSNRFRMASAAVLPVPIES